MKYQQVIDEAVLFDPLIQKIKNNLRVKLFNPDFIDITSKEFASGNFDSPFNLIKEYFINKNIPVDIIIDKSNDDFQGQFTAGFKYDSKNGKGKQTVLPRIKLYVRKILHKSNIDNAYNDGTISKDLIYKFFNQLITVVTHEMIHYNQTLRDKRQNMPFIGNNWEYLDKIETSIAKIPYYNRKEEMMAYAENYISDLKISGKSKNETLQILSNPKSYDERWSKNNSNWKTYRRYLYDYVIKYFDKI